MIIKMPGVSQYVAIGNDIQPIDRKSEADRIVKVEALLVHNVKKAKGSDKWIAQENLAQFRALDNGLKLEIAISYGF